MAWTPRSSPGTGLNGCPGVQDLITQLYLLKHEERGVLGSIFRSPMQASAERRHHLLAERALLIRNLQQICTTDPSTSHSHPHHLPTAVSCPCTTNRSSQTTSATRTSRLEQHRIHQDNHLTQSTYTNKHTFCLGPRPTQTQTLQLD